MKAGSLFGKLGVNLTRFLLVSCPALSLCHLDLSHFSYFATVFVYIFILCFITNSHEHYWFVLLTERVRMFLVVCGICSRLVWEDASARGVVGGCARSSPFFSRCVFCVLFSQVTHVLIYLCVCYTFHAAVYTNT